MEKPQLVFCKDQIEAHNYFKERLKYDGEIKAGLIRCKILPGGRGGAAIGTCTIKFLFLVCLGFFLLMSVFLTTNFSVSCLVHYVSDL